MAQKLSDERAAGNGPTRVSYLELVERCDDIDEELLGAKETVRSINRRKKDLRTLIVAEGHDIAVFDRARKDRDIPGEVREALDAEYRRDMVWLDKPVGFQVPMDTTVVPMSERDLRRVEKEGHDAGKRGDRADSNSYTPGREEYQRWHAGWLQGQASKVGDEIKPASTAPSVRKGRPLGSRNRPKEQPELSADAAPAERNEGAYLIGKADGLEGVRDHAARFAPDADGHADYEAGHAEGQRDRQEAIAAAGAAVLHPETAAG